MYLFTLEQAKRHLRIVDAMQDQDVQDRRADASAVVLDYLDPTIVSTAHWFDTSGEPIAVPGHVKAAALIVMGNLYYNREGLEAEPLNDSVRMLLNRTRRPTVI